MKEKIIKTKCDWCGKDIECPEDMINVKQACYECFKKGMIKGKVHIDIPTKELEKDFGF